MCINRLNFNLLTNTESPNCAGRLFGDFVETKLTKHFKEFLLLLNSNYLDGTLNCLK